MMEEVGVVSAQHVELVAGRLRRPDLRQHVERPGREPRQHPVAEGAGDHRGQQEHRQAGVGRQLGRRQILHGQWSTPSVGKIGGVVQVVSAQGDGWVRGYEAHDRQEALGVRHQPEGLGLAEDAQRGDRHAGHLRRHASTSPTARIPSTAKASATSTRSTPPSAATSRRPAASGTTTRSAARSRRRRSPTACSTIADFSGFLHCLDAKTGQAVLDARHVRRRLGLADGRSTARSTSATRTATSSCSQAGKDEEGARRDEHGQRRSTRRRCRPTARCSSSTATSCSRSP